MADLRLIRVNAAVSKCADIVDEVPKEGLPADLVVALCALKSILQLVDVMAYEAKHRQRMGAEVP